MEISYFSIWLGVVLFTVFHVIPVALFLRVTFHIIRKSHQKRYEDIYEDTVYDMLCPIISTLAKRASIQKPGLLIDYSNTLTMVSTAESHSITKGFSAIYISDKFLKYIKPDEKEVESILAHEIAHIERRDFIRRVGLSLFCSFLGIASFVILASMVLQISVHWFWKGSLYLIIMYIFAYWVPVVITFFVCRQQEFCADRQATILTGTPDDLIQLWEKIKDHNEEVLESRKVLGSAKPSVENSNPPKLFLGSQKLCSSHPSLEERIERLKKMKNVS